MGRIRTIKPEFPQSESMGRISRDARLTFILLWTMADDAGRLRGHPKLIANLLFPCDDDAGENVETWLDELVQEGCIARYKADGHHYIEICQWRKHQKIDHPTASRFPENSQKILPLANPREDSPLDLGEDLGRDQGEEGMVYPVTPRLKLAAPPTLPTPPTRCLPPASPSACHEEAAAPIADWFWQSAVQPTANECRVGLERSDDPPSSATHIAPIPRAEWRLAAQTQPIPKPKSATTALQAPPPAGLRRARAAEQWNNAELRRSTLRPEGANTPYRRIQHRPRFMLHHPIATMTMRRKALRFSVDLRFWHGQPSFVGWVWSKATTHHHIRTRFTSGQVGCYANPPYARARMPRHPQVCVGRAKRNNGATRNCAGQASARGAQTFNPKAHAPSRDTTKPSPCETTQRTSMTHKEALPPPATPARTRPCAGKMPLSPD
jgi:hypothetical protein